MSFVSCLVLTACLVKAQLQSSPDTPGSTSQNEIGAFINSGLGVATTSMGQSLSPVNTSTIISIPAASQFTRFTNTSSSQLSSTITFISSSAISTTYASANSTTFQSTNLSQPLTTQPFPSIILGPPPVQACYLELWDWYSSSRDAAISSGYYTVSTSIGTPYVTTYKPFIQQLTSVNATRLTTLCDGHPRAIGLTSEDYGTAITSDIATTTIWSSIPDYPTKPCSIAPSDCSPLWSSYLGLNKTAAPIAEVLAPPCPRTSETTVPFEAGLCMASGAWQGQIIAADKAQLLYWPVRLKSPAGLHVANDSLNEFCTGLFPDAYNPNYTVPATLPGTPTAAGPNTAVFSGVTITSPDVAMYFKGLWPIRGCGTRTDTVITMPANSVSSLRAARVLAIREPMHYNDLNWVCQDDSNPTGPWTTQDLAGENCYQDVPAVAYFSNIDRYDKYTPLAEFEYDVAKTLTMLNDYHPNLMPDQGVRSAIVDLYGPAATWFYGGIWDPPYALSSATDAADPTAGPTTSAGPAQTTPATAAQSIAGPTVTATSTPIVTSKIANQQVSSVAAADPSTGHDSHTTNTSPSAATPSQAVASAVDQPQVNAGTTSLLVHTVQSQVVNVGSSSLTAIVSGSNIIVAGTTLVPGAATSVAGQQISNGGGLVVGSGTIATTVNIAATSQEPVQVVSIGSTAVPVVISNSNVIIAGTTIAAGSAATINGQQVSNNGALVVGAGISAATIVLASSQAQASAQIVNIGGSAVTAVASGSNAVVAGSTLTPGSVATIAGQQVSLAGSSLVIGTGAAASTIAIQPASPSISTIAPGVVAFDGQTLTAGASAKTLSNGQQVSLGSNGVLIPIATTLPAVAAASQVTIGSSVIPISSVGSGVIVVGSQTLSAGGQPGSLQGEQLSVGANGLVIGTGSSARTVAVSAASQSVVTIGSQTFFRSVASNGVEVLSNAQTKFTLTPGGPATTVNGELLSAGKDGLLVSAAQLTLTGLNSLPTVQTKNATSSGQVKSSATSSAGLISALASSPGHSSAGRMCGDMSKVVAILGLLLAVLYVL